MLLLNTFWKLQKKLKDKSVTLSFKGNILGHYFLLIWFALFSLCCRLIVLPVKNMLSFFFSKVCLFALVVSDLKENSEGDL